MAHRLYILNGPNLNMLGRREPEVYGSATLDDIKAQCAEIADDLNFDLFFAQSNAESQLIEWLHQARDEDAAVIINPAGLAYGSVALHDAMRMVRLPIVEVHLTNIFGRDEIYRRPLTSHAAWGFIAGLGPSGYELAMRGLATKLAGCGDC